MTTDNQRYCPQCDAAFLAGEAVLRCSNCGRLHHPACWVRNRGCSNGCEAATPEPLAFDSPPHRSGFRHPAEGTRVAARGETPGPLPHPEAPTDPVERVTPVLRQQTPGEPMIGGAPSAAPSPIGRARPNAGSTSDPEPRIVTPPPRAQHGRLVRSDGKPPVEDLKLYGNRGIMQYWYVPVAILLAIVVAAGVIFAADRLFGGDDGDSLPAAGETETPDATVDDASPGASPAATNAPGAASPTTAASPTSGTSPAAPGELAVGSTAVVTGTGECLNIREAPGTDSTAVGCLPDGTQLRIIGGPTDAGNFTWWQVDTEGASGWAAEDFLQPAE